ncbi:SDR family oxidoreductase [Azospirillum canadense]|uniref:SDR family oxidoreductase n=1 Tax=Azospirillum canadense TaxID=403962 RepID=UPI002226B3DF|nr:SDR family oxidoreductase [Azospirillum canadense]MCW2241737.1 3-oxoacyl-[acyl-carrier protein] reductase [Azospirillum canadense]
MDLGLTNKTALVLGSSRGLGLSVASVLAAEGAQVVLCGRNEERTRAAAESIVAAGGRAVAVTVDLADAGAAAQLGAAMERLGLTVDILVLNSGGPPPGSVLGVEPGTWTAQFGAMVQRLIEIAGVFVPGMRARGWGRVLTIASSGVVQPIPNLGISNTLRAALVGWSKTLAAEVASDGVTVNTIVPGRIHTERVDELDAAAAKRTGKTAEEIAAQSRATIPVGRYGKVEELAAVAAFLAGEPAAYVTGSVVRVDGGMIRSV